MALITRYDLARPIRFLILSGGLLISGTLSGQTRKTDSIEVAGLIGQAHEKLIKHDYASANQLAQVGLEKSSHLNFKWGLINSLLIIGQTQRSLRNYPVSLNHYLQALAEVQKQNDQQTLIYVNLKIGELFQEWNVPEKALPYFTTVLSLQTIKGNEPSPSVIERLAEVHLSLNQKEKSLEKYFQLLEITRTQKDPAQTRRVLEKIALIYAQSNDIANSLKFNLQILEIDRQLKDTFNTAGTLNIIGNQYKDLNNVDKALEYYQAALSLNRQPPKLMDSDNRIAANLMNIGSIYQSRGDARNAIKSFNEALEIKEKTGSPIEIAVMHNYLATLYLAQQNYSEAEDHTKLSIDLLKGTDNKRILARNYKRLSEIYEKQANYEKAFSSFQSYSLLKDSLLYQEQLEQEKGRLKELVIEGAEKEAKLSLIDHEMQALELKNEREIAEREKQQIALQLKEKEFQNLSLQKEQLEQARAVQQLQILQNKAEQEKQEQAILLLEQKRDLQNADIQKKELLEIERKKEIVFKNTRLALQQSQLERIGIRQQFLLIASILFLLIIALILISYMIKRRDNQKLQAQYDEINRQKMEIEVINKTLVELNEEKNDLIGIVAHDLKSPLNQIDGMLEIIKLTTKNQSEEHLEYVAKIEQATSRLKKMITKILDVSAIESQTLNISSEQININELLGEVVNRFAAQAEKKGITITREFDQVPPITSDAGYVSEVLENLMSNAVKYSPLGKQVTVRLHKNSNAIRIQFKDQGQGISQNDLKNLFGKYHKLAARPTAGEDSTGLGLSIVKKYVLALNGRVWCESEEGKGSNFIVELPIS